MPAPPASFVGRAGERRRVARLWPKSRLVAIVGPAGMGKTALARRLAEDLAPRRSALASCAAGSFLDAAEAGLGLPALPTGRADRALRVASVLDRRGLLLCVEDAHALAGEEWAAFLEVARHLRRGRLLATSRSPIALGDLGPTATVVELGPLPAEDATRLVEELLDRLGRQADAALLARAAAGSPQWCGLLAAGGRVGERLADLLDALTPPEQEALARLAVFDAPVPPGLLELSASTVAALAARFLVDRPDGRTVGLHALVRDAALARLGARGRAALHQRAAAVCATGGDTAGRLRHLEAAGDRGGLAAALSEGGDAWLASQLRAAEYLRLAAWIEEGGVRLDDRLELRRALCCLSLGRTAEAERAFARVPAPRRAGSVLHAAVAVRISREHDAPAALRRALLAQALGAEDPSAQPADRGDLLLAWVWEGMHDARHGGWDEAMAACRSALAPASAVDDITRARAARILGELCLERGDVEAASRALTEAEARANRLGSATLRLFLEGTWVQHHVRYGSLAEARRRLARLEALPLPAEASREEASRTFRRAEVLARAGRLTDAVRALDACASRQPVLAIGLRCSLLSYTAAYAAEAGEDERAARAARALLAVPRARRPWHYGVEAPLALARVELRRGRLARAERRARLAVAMAVRAGLFERAARAAVVLGEIALASGRAGDALALGRGVAESAGPLGARPLEARARTLLAEALAASGALAGAQDEAAEALRLAETTGSSFLVGSARAALARVVLAAGDRPGAARLMAEARAGLRRAHAPALEAALQALGAAIEVAPAGHDLWMDARTGRVVIDGARRVDLGARPLLARLLACVLDHPATPLGKDVLFAEAWRLPYRPARDTTVYKAVARLGHALDPDAPHRFLRWDADGRLVLVAASPRLVRPEARDA